MARIRWDGDASTAVRAQEALTAAQKKYEEQCGKSVKKTKELEAAAKAAAAEEKKLVDAANKIKESVDPQTKLNRLTQELAEHVKKGRLSIDQATQAHMKYRQELGLGVTKAKEAATANEAAFGSKALSNVGAYLAGMVSIGSAISLIRGELQAIVAVNEKAAQKTLTAAGAEAALRETISGDPQRDRMISEANKIADSAKLPVASIYQAMEQSYAAGGDADLAINLVREGSRQSRDPGRMISMSAGIGDVVQGSNIKDTEEAAGYLAIVQKTSRIKGEKVAQEVGRTVGAYVAAGGSEATAAAVISALSVAGQDAQGELSRTAAINLIGETKDFFKENPNGLKPEQVDTPGERIALLQGNPQWAKQFLETTEFRAPMEGAISKMFMFDDAKAIYNKAFSENDERSERLAAARGRAGFIREGDLQLAQLSEDAIGSEREKLEIEWGKKGILTTEKRDALINTAAEARGTPYFVQRWNAWVDSGEVMSRREAIAFGERALAANVETGTVGDAKAEKSLERMISELKLLNQKSGARSAARREDER